MLNILAGMGLNTYTVFCQSIANHGYPYCQCYKGSSIADVMRICKCGENVKHPIEWSWDRTLLNPGTQINDDTVLFHKHYSQGSSIVRGEERLKPGMIHYWEIKVLSPMSGTDTIFGIGTDKFDLTQHRYTFASSIGINEHSWGYSYRGVIQHKAIQKLYGRKFVQGSIIGVYLDLFLGRIEFFLNRRSQGIAYRNLPTTTDINLYPLSCSTSSKATIKLINSQSSQSTLQFYCMKTISKNQRLSEEVQKIPGVRNLCKEFWFLLAKERFHYDYSKDSSKTQPDLEDEAILCRTQIKKLKFDNVSSENDLKSHSSDHTYDTKMIDLYNDIDNIRHRKTDYSSDEEDFKLTLDHTNT